MQRRKRKTLKRFALSFLGVLVLPVMFFVYLFMSDFREVYRNKVMDQIEIALTKTADELDRQIETLYDIVTYNSRLDHFQPYSVVNDITGKGIMSALNAEEAVHSIIESVHYYHPAKPERIYTSQGTYTLDFYAELVAGVESKEQLLAAWNSMEGDGWIYTKKAFSGGNETTSLQYVIKTKTQERWIFTLSNKVLEQVLGEAQMMTVLTDKAGNQLLVSDRRTDGENNNYEISAMSKIGYFQLIRSGDETELFFEVLRVQERFWRTVIIVLIIGFFLVGALTVYNEYPIRKLQKYCMEKVSHIPMSLGGMEVFLFSFKNIEKKVALLEQKQGRERLLLQLLLDKNCGTEEFRKKLMTIWHSSITEVKLQKQILNFWKI